MSGEKGDEIKYTPGVPEDVEGLRQALINMVANGQANSATRYGTLNRGAGLKGSDTFTPAQINAGTNPMQTQGASMISNLMGKGNYVPADNNYYRGGWGGTTLGTGRGGDDGDHRRNPPPGAPRDPGPGGPGDPPPGDPGPGDPGDPEQPPGRRDPPPMMAMMQRPAMPPGGPSPKPAIPPGGPVKPGAPMGGGSDMMNQMMMLNALRKRRKFGGQ